MVLDSSDESIRTRSQLLEPIRFVKRGMYYDPWDSGTGAHYPFDQLGARTEFHGSQKTVSSGHPWPSGRGKWDVGGNFWTSRDWYGESGGAPDKIRNKLVPVGTYQYHEGPQVAESQRFIMIPDSVGPSSASQLNELGTTAIARTIPTNPVAGAAVFLGELREGLPSIIGSQLLRDRTKSMRERAGSEYLNVEFGWKPLIADLQKFAKSAKESEKTLKQLRRDSGRNVRRRYTFGETSTVEHVTLANGFPAPACDTSFYVGHAADGYKRTLTKTLTRRQTFSGMYTYHLDVGTDVLSRFNRYTQEANKLLGVRLTPEVVWNLAPWSWAADWVSNTGDVIHNLSAFQSDGLVLRYGYIMEETTYTMTYTLHGVGFVSHPGPYTLSQTFGKTWKVRQRASPFGFGLSFDGFSNRQLAILAALGMSRSGRSTSR